MNYTHNCDNLDFATDTWLESAYEDQFDSPDAEEIDDWYPEGDFGDED